MLPTIRSAVSRMSLASRGGRAFSGDVQSSSETDVIETKTAPEIERPIKANKLPSMASMMSLVQDRDLEEKFVSGWGPGGQKVNKALNCCQLKHIPTGIVVKVHQTRSLEQNRKIARQLLARRLDNLYNGEESVANRKKQLALHKAAVREAEAERRRQMKEEYKRTLSVSPNVGDG